MWILIPFLIAAFSLRLEFVRRLKQQDPATWREWGGPVRYIPLAKEFAAKRYLWSRKYRASADEGFVRYCNFYGVFDLLATTGALFLFGYILINKLAD